MKRRGRRRRNVRTQQPVRVTQIRTGAGGVTVLETYEWMRPPSGWDIAVAGMSTQVRKARAHQKKQARRRFIARSEARREAKAEAWRARYRKPGTSPFNALPGMANHSAPINRRPPAIPADARRRAGMASRGAASTLDPQTAQHILSLMAEGWTITAIAKELGIPRTTLSRWLSSGRAEKVAAAVGEGRPIRANTEETTLCRFGQTLTQTGVCDAKTD